MLTYADGHAVADDPALDRLAQALKGAAHAGHVVGVSPNAMQAPLLAAGRNGAGWTLGRYAGQLTLDGASVLIEPRMGWHALDGWVAAATGLHVPAAAGGDVRARVSALSSILWVRAIDGASRHGPPAFRREVQYVGGSVRGRLDVRRTVRLRAQGSTSAASAYRARELDNPVTRIIVAADRVLLRHVGRERWRTDRVDAVLAQLHSAVGRRAHTPGDGELHRMRYTPITRPFKWAAELSSRIVRQDPVATTALPGRVQDLDGIYREATLNWSREARPDLRAETVDSGQVVLRDRQFIRVTLGLLPAPSVNGAPVLTVLRPGALPQRLELPTDAREASLKVGRVLAATR